MTLYMTGGSITINGSVNVDLTAPTSGPYRGLVIYQERGLSSPPSDTFNGGSTLDFEGSIYLPGSHVDYTGNTTATTTALIADTITFSTSKFGTDTGGSVTGIGVATVAIIE